MKFTPQRVKFLHSIDVEWIIHLIFLRVYARFSEGSMFQRFVIRRFVKSRIEKGFINPKMKLGSLIQTFKPVAAYSCSHLQCSFRINEPLFIFGLTNQFRNKEQLLIFGLTNRFSFSNYRTFRIIPFFIFGLTNPFFFIFELTNLRNYEPFSLSDYRTFGGSNLRSNELSE